MTGRLTCKIDPAGWGKMLERQNPISDPVPDVRHGGLLSMILRGVRQDHFDLAAIKLHQAC